MLFFFWPGETLAYFNLTEVLGETGKMTSASHHLSAAVRVAAVSNKYRVMTLVLYPDHNATEISFHLKGYRSTEQDAFEVKQKDQRVIAWMTHILSFSLSSSLSQSVS